MSMVADLVDADDEPSRAAECGGFSTMNNLSGFQLRPGEEKGRGDTDSAGNGAGHPCHCPSCS